jgi:hypothetical protein
MDYVIINLYSVICIYVNLTNDIRLAIFNITRKLNTNQIRKLVGKC